MSFSVINEGNLPKAIVVIGPTAVGKTEYAIEIAERYNGEIVSADSMQIYRGLDIGTAKPSVEELARVPHHMIGFVDPAREYSAAKYREDAAAIIFDIRARGRLPVICGGTGLYINALIYDMDFSGTGKDEAIRGKYEELADVYGSMYIYGILKERDPEGAERIHPNNKKRIIRALERLETGGESEGLHEFERSFVPGSLFDPVLILLERSREELLIRIDARVDRLIATGLEEEVRGLIDAGLGSGHISMLGIGYKELMRYLDDEYDRAEAIELIKVHTHQYAKRQMTWFRRYENMYRVQLGGCEVEKETALEKIFRHIDAEL